MMASLFTDEFNILSSMIYGDAGKGYCYICFNSKDEILYSGSDNFFISSEYFEENLILSNIAESVMNIKIKIDPSSQTYCSQCVSKIVDFYLFRERFQQSEKMWLSSYDKLSNYLNVVDLSNVKCNISKIYIDLTVDYITGIKSKSVNKRVTKVDFVCDNDDKEDNNFDNKYPFKIYRRALENLSLRHEDGRKFFKCKKCKATYEKLKSFQRHYLTKCYQNGICSDRDVMAEIERNLKEDKCYICPKCNLVYDKKKSYEIHLRQKCFKENYDQAVNLTDYVCKKCGFKSRKSIEFQQHLKLVCYKDDVEEIYSSYDINSFICELCGKGVTTQRGYETHKKICRAKTLGEFSEKYICHMCAAVFYIKNTLIAHIRQCHSEEVFPCKVCGKEFNAKVKVDKHQIVHTRERNFECDICHKWFVTREARLFHRRIHTGERPIKCSLCDMSFISKSRRMDHMKRVHLKPAYKCSICSHEFYRSSQLKNHSKTHSKKAEVMDVF